MERFWIISLVCFIVLFGLIFGLPIYMGLDDERIVVEGSVEFVEIVESSNDGNEEYEIILLKMINGSEYRIRIENSKFESKSFDFTVDSKIIIKLYRQDVDSDWEIVRLYKVPGED